MIGVDLAFIDRFTRLREKFGDKVASRFLNQSEISLVKNDKTLAGFWAAKEAISKALGCGVGSKFSFFDIEIYKDSLGAPKVKIINPNLTQNFQIKSINISITHDQNIAAAVAFIEK